MTEHTPQSEYASQHKQIPAEKAVRDLLRRRTHQCAEQISTDVNLTRERLDALARAILAEFSLPEDYLGFTMVALNNACWKAAFQSIPYHRRLLLLPKCLRSAVICSAQIDSVGLHCAHCGGCLISEIINEASALGYQTLVAEGTSSVLIKILDNDADALLGVACLDSLEKSFAQISAIGIPCQAVPLLSDGCIDSKIELEMLRELLHAKSNEIGVVHPRSYLPLLRYTRRLFMENLPELLAPVSEVSNEHEDTALQETDSISYHWVREGGKRLRPFITLAAYVMARYGEGLLADTTNYHEVIPPAVGRLAIAIEVMHKASLVHDDLEDHDAFRYGNPTLHRTYGNDVAINIGDFLLGIGYRLITCAVDALGAECVVDLLAAISDAHLQLARGQGGELLIQRQSAGVTPLDVLEIYALKTAPAFQVALYVGLRAAGAVIDEKALQQYSRYLGEAYQIKNDLDDWRIDAQNKAMLGQDILSGRPTILLALAEQQGGASVQQALRTLRDGTLDAQAVIAESHALFLQTKAFSGAEALLKRFRERALEIAAQVETPAISTLMQFLVQIILPEDEGEEHQARWQHLAS